MTAVSVSQDLVISAVRYALGRSTYIVGATVNEVIRVWPELSQNTRKVIARDVSSWLTYEHSGMAMDAADWLRLMRHAEGGAVTDSPAERLRPLGDLLGELTTTAETGLWRYRCHLGDAGHIDVTYRFNPADLTDAERTELLTFAARLVNWSHE